ncbi:MAG: hypothetical protein ABSD96_23015 [Candidatus Korobacteraceae bacterium]|jgi:hypothetical protein
MLAISRTPQFRQFQRAAGNATFHINTIVIGLELVARGGERPVELNINWKRPLNPRQTTEQTKQFVLLAVIAHVLDSFDVLLRDYADLPWFSLDTTLRDVLRKSKTPLGGKELSVRDRVGALLSRLGTEEPDSLALFAVTVAWRNTLVHIGRAKPTLPDGVEEQLKAGASRLSSRYAAIDVQKMLVNFRTGNRPTLKEATTMVAVCQNLARVIDAAVIRDGAGTPEQISRIVSQELARSFGQEQSRWKAVWGRNAAAQTRAVLNHLTICGLTDTEDDPISAVLTPETVYNIALSVRSELELSNRASR